MSADRSPVGGRACLMLSILTASTGPSAGTGSPVNGDSSAALRGDADGGAGPDEPVSATISQTPRARAATPAGTLIAITRWRGVMTLSSPKIHFPHQAVPAEQIPWVPAPPAVQRLSVHVSRPLRTWRSRRSQDLGPRGSGHIALVLPDGGESLALGSAGLALLGMARSCAD